MLGESATLITAQPKTFPALMDVLQKFSDMEPVLQEIASGEKTEFSDAEASRFGSSKMKLALFNASMDDRKQYRDHSYYEEFKKAEKLASAMVSFVSAVEEEARAAQVEIEDFHSTRIEFGYKRAQDAQKVLSNEAYKNALMSHPQLAPSVTALEEVFGLIEQAHLYRQTLSAEQQDRIAEIDARKKITALVGDLFEYSEHIMEQTGMNPDQAAYYKHELGTPLTGILRAVDSMLKIAEKAPKRWADNFIQGEKDNVPDSSKTR